MTSAFDLRHTVADLTDDADALLASRSSRACNLKFYFLYEVSHGSSQFQSGTDRTLHTSESGFERRKLGAHAPVVHIASDLDAHAADKPRVLGERRL
jgi:hypothetical protein